MADIRVWNEEKGHPTPWCGERRGKLISLLSEDE